MIGPLRKRTKMLYSVRFEYDLNAVSNSWNFSMVLCRFIIDDPEDLC